MGARLGAALAAAICAACAGVRTPSTPAAGPLTTRVTGPGLAFELRYGDVDAPEVGRVGSGLLAAGARATRWGAFRAGVYVDLLPDHESLERAVQQRGLAWLRGWATADRVFLQSPRSWDGATAEALQAQLDELLAHELTHALMYQLMAPDDALASGWLDVEEPPLWFREGMASVTAGQGHRRMSREDVARWALDLPGVNPLRPQPAMLRATEEKEAVYGAAHRAFELLLEVCGDRCVRDVLRGVRSGARFADAFAAETGHALDAFEDQAIQSGFDVTALRRAATRTGGAGP